MYKAVNEWNSDGRKSNKYYGWQTRETLSKCREGNKKIELPCSTDSKTSIFPPVNTVEIRLSLNSQWHLIIIWTRELCGEVGNSWPWANLVSAVHVVGTLIELCTSL